MLICSVLNCSGFELASVRCKNTTTCRWWRLWGGVEEMVVEEM